MRPQPHHRHPSLLRSIRSVVGLIAAFMFIAAIPADAAKIVNGNAPSVQVETNKGSLVRLNAPANTVFVSDPEICDIQVKSPTLVYLLGKKPGQTTLFAVGENDRVLANINITVTHNLTRLNAAVQQLYPEAEVNFSSIEDSIVIDGLVENASMSENIRRMAERFVGKDAELVNLLGITAPTQVNLRVRVAEVSRDIEKQLGFNWEIIGNIGDLGLRVTTFNPFNVASTPDNLNVDFCLGDFDFNALIDALDDEGLISVLAEPNLTALSGETASFLAGGEFPILVPQGDNTIAVEFKSFGVSLAFTPTILNGSRINLHVRPEVSALSSEGAVSVPIGFDSVLTVPALKTRRAETTVELASGQSFAIAGLLENSVNHDIHKFPFLADIPVMGNLFKSDRFRRNESELVIIVTPYVVRPSPTRLAGPTDGFAAPSDTGRRMHGPWRRNPVKGSPSTVGRDGTRLIGPAGYLLD